jgi:Tfp pilus assembly PilM family ATPase
VFRKKQKSVVGLDIGSSAVKAVELKPTAKDYRVAAFGIEPVPADAIVDGAIHRRHRGCDVDQEHLREERVQEQRTSARRCRAAR